VPLLELRRLGAELVVRERLEVGLEVGDVRGLLLQALRAATFAEAQDLLETAEVGGRHRHRVPARLRRARRVHADLTAADRKPHTLGLAFAA
jgi:hypothetical protein